jgi:hypothetical protein
MVSILFALHKQCQYVCRNLPASFEWHLLRIRVPSSAELCAESRQFSSLVLHIQQLLRARVPQRRIPYALCALVYWLGVRCAQCEGAAVGEGNELCEGVGALQSLEQGRVPYLGRLPGLKLQSVSESTERAH